MLAKRNSTHPTAHPVITTHDNTFQGKWVASGSVKDSMFVHLCCLKVKNLYKLRGYNCTHTCILSFHPITFQGNPLQMLDCNNLPFICYGRSQSMKPVSVRKWESKRQRTRFENIRFMREYNPSYGGAHSHWLMVHCFWGISMSGNGTMLKWVHTSGCISLLWNVKALSSHQLSVGSSGAEIMGHGWLWLLCDAKLYMALGECVCLSWLMVEVRVCIGEASCDQIYVHPDLRRYWSRWVVNTYRRESGLIQTCNQPIGPTRDPPRRLRWVVPQLLTSFGPIHKPWRLAVNMSVCDTPIILQFLDTRMSRNVPISHVQIQVSTHACRIIPPWSC